MITIHYEFVIKATAIGMLAHDKFHHWLHESLLEVKRRLYASKGQTQQTIAQ